MSRPADPRQADLERRADAAMAAGRTDEALRAWDQLLALEPRHARAAFHVGSHALKHGDLGAARELLERAASLAPDEPATHFHLSVVRRLAGDAAGEIAALEAALVADPYFFPALIAKAGAMERAGKKRRAARIYKDAQTIAPPPSQRSPEVEAALEHARGVIAANQQALHAHLARTLEPVRARHAGERLARFDECRDIMVGTKKVYQPDPTLLYFPQLPPIGYFDDSHFPWLPELEAGTAAIREELVALIEAQAPGFRPYIAAAPGTPVNQWAELANSPRWSGYFFWDDGQPVPAARQTCPRTAALLDRMPLPKVPGRSPTAFFSTLDPRSHIPPHTGVTNTRLTVHLPLIVPPDCGFRVGNETRPWVAGKAWVFDDTIEHEAWNRSDHLRVILIFDTWNPYLSAAERDLVAAMYGALDAYYGNEA
jgi:aspartyl/asparaginyl beta-hydroxylase (cupin superfamily)